MTFILIGFAAQLIDGALGMAFGLISSTLLIATGVPPAAASAGVHTAETFTTAVSGVSHVAHRNVDWKLFFRIVIPGVVGGVTGAYLLTQISADVAKPFVLSYLTVLGAYLLYRGVMHKHTERAPKVVAPLGLAGGFLDAAGGGGWRNPCGDQQGAGNQAERHAERAIDQLGGKADQDEGHEDGRVGQQLRENACSPPY